MTREEFNLRSQRTNVYFVESKINKYVPRAILVDLDYRGIQEALSPLHSHLFNKDNIIVGKTGANGIWAKAYYTKEAEIEEKILERVRKEAEFCDLIQGIQIVHALSGGTGSGLSSLLVPSLMEEYSNKVLKSYSVMPTMNRLINNNIAIINTVLTIPYLIDYIHETFCMDNETLSRSLYLPPMTNKFYNDQNRLISFVMSDITACLRFPGQLNTDLRKLLVNMVPFPRLHFLVPGHVPQMTSKKSSRSFYQMHHKMQIKELLQQMFDSKSMFLDCNSKTGRFLTAAAIFRGSEISPTLVDEKMLNIQNRAKIEQDNSSFVKWLANNIKTAMCNIAPMSKYHLKMCATWLSNTTAIVEPLNQLSNHFESIFQRRQNLHHYISEGMEESQFLEALDNLRFLISEYKKYQNAPIETNIVETLTPY
ncbi:tubulin beta-2 chain-like isoform X2 [Linepithema humile]